MRTLTVVLMACAVLVLAPAAQAVLIAPSGLNPGDIYHWAFVTSTTRDATSTDIADYNTFVQNAANAGSLTAGSGLTWKAVASTDTVDARDNAPVTGAVYLLDGRKVASGYTQFWGTSYESNTPALLVGIVVTENGVSVEEPLDEALPVWTGSYPDGTKGDGHDMLNDDESGWPLGHSVTDEDPMFGDARGWEHRYNGHFMFEWKESRTDSYPLYALSGPIPEPATLALLGLGGIAMLIRRKKR